MLLKHCISLVTTLRRFEKFDNKSIWYAIKNIINLQTLIVYLHKVKAHQEASNNDIANHLAKDGVNLPHNLALITILLSLPTFSID